MSQKQATESAQSDQNELIRTSAYYKWERAGSPVSDGLDFWLEAEKEYVDRDRQPQLANTANEKQPAIAHSNLGASPQMI